MDFIFKNFIFFKWWTYLYQVKQGCQRNTISCLIFCEIWLAKMLMRLVCTSFRLCVCLADNIYKLEDIIALLPFVKCICFLSIKFFILIACLCYLTFIFVYDKNCQWIEHLWNYCDTCIHCSTQFTAGRIISVFSLIKRCFKFFLKYLFLIYMTNFLIYLLNTLLFY